MFKGQRIIHSNDSTEQNTTQPVKLDVDTLLVTDLTVYNDHRRFSGSNDQNVVFLHMKIYFLHLMNGVFEYFFS